MAIPRRQFVRNAGLAAAACALPWPRAWADDTRAQVNGAQLTLANDVIAASWDAGAGLRLAQVQNRRTGARLLAAPVPAFSLVCADGVVDAGAMRIAAPARVEPLPVNPHAANLAERLPGRALVLVLRDEQRGLEVTWSAMLRAGSHYLRQQVEVTAQGEAVMIGEIVLLDAEVDGIAVAGTVKGSPLTAGDWFLGFEHPLAVNRVDGARAHAGLERQLPLPPRRPVAYSSVIGVAGAGQMRRDFLAYIERERAHPYRPFLHYNSWYDLGYFTPYDEAGALDVIAAFGAELHARRGVRLDSFLFDDGWDDHRMWGFNAGFPHGFTPLRAAANAIGAAPGVWLSPWGGYGAPRAERLAYGKAHGFEINASGFSLSGPVYFQHFREVCLDMIARYGVNQFKIDGTGSSATVTPGSAFGSDFEAAISLIGDLRAARPDLFINLTTGTYPSPFWLRYADSTWRGGSDHSFAGVGSDRQQWITYRDAQTWRNIVRRGPLYPLNSLMLHGIIYARFADKLKTDPGGDFDAEVRAYFGTGTQLQEMYVTHSLLQPHDWDKLAESGNWARKNAATLVDTHWVGGDPAQLEPYGHAAWSARKAILTLRNPSDRAQTLQLDPATAFELPTSATAPIRLRPAYAQDQWRQPQPNTVVELHPGSPQEFALKPFEVLTLES